MCFCLHCLCHSLVNHSKDLLHVLIHHIGDADSRNYFEKVGRDASVQAWHTFMRYDVFELTHHGQFGFTLSDSWKNKGEQWKLQKLTNGTDHLLNNFNGLVHSNCLKPIIHSISHPVPACESGSEQGDMMPAGHRCWKQCHNRAGPKLLGLLNWHSTSGARHSSWS